MNVSNDVVLVYHILNYPLVLAIHSICVVETDFADIAVEVASHWKALGRDLRLNKDTLESIGCQYSDNPKKCLNEVLSAWLGRLHGSVPPYASLGTRPCYVGQCTQQHCNASLHVSLSTSKKFTDHHVSVVCMLVIM